MRYVRIEPISDDWIRGFKAFAHIDDCDNIVIINALNTAIQRVQEMADRALIDCKVKIRGTADYKGIVPLYLHPVTEIESVVDWSTGEPVGYTATAGNEAIRPVTTGTVIVTYRVSVDTEAARGLKTYVYQLASAIYDGNDEEQNLILSQIPQPLVC